MPTLRSATIRLAYANPSLRPYLLPLLKEANKPSVDRQIVKFIDDLTGDFDDDALNENQEDTLRKMAPQVYKRFKRYPTTTEWKKGFLGLGDRELHRNQKLVYNYDGMYGKVVREIENHLDFSDYMLNNKAAEVAIKIAPAVKKRVGRYPTEEEWEGGLGLDRNDLRKVERKKMVYYYPA